MTTTESTTPAIDEATDTAPVASSPRVAEAQAVIDRALAQRTDPAERREFLDQLEALIEGMGAPPEAPTFVPADRPGWDQYIASLAAQTHRWADAIINALCNHDLEPKMAEARQRWVSAVVVSNSTDTMAARVGCVLALDVLCAAPDLLVALVKGLRADLVEYDERLSLLSQEATRDAGAA